MKKILLLLTVFSMVFTSCDPLEDIYTEVDAESNAVVGDVVYTLTDDDYEELELSYGSFSSEDDAKAALPAFLADKYPVWGKGSSALIEYQLYIGNAFDLDNYNLDQDDYTFSGSDLLGFESTSTPSDYLADIISDNFSSPNEGDYVAASYFQFTGSTYTVTPTISFDENFDYGTTAGDLTTVSSGDWEAHSGAGNGPIGFDTTSLSMTDYPSSDIAGSLTVDSSGSEDVTRYFTEISSGIVYASTLVNLSEVNDGTYTFHLRDSDFAVGYVARVGAKDDGSGNILFGIGASSSTLTYGTTPYALNTTYLLVSSYNIENGEANLYILPSVETTQPVTPEASSSGTSGAIVSGVSIRQGGGGPTGVFDGIRIANTWSALMTNDVLADEVVGGKVESNVIYTFDGTDWVLPTNDYYAVTEADFTSMGITSFGSSTSADDYLPAFLNLKFPYAQEGTTLDVVYDYVSSSSGAQVRGDLYTKESGVWSSFESTITASLQLAHDGSSWVPDNTIKHELDADDYALIISTYKTVAGYETSVQNLEAYGNISTFNWTEEQIDAALNTVIVSNYPGMEEGQKFAITVYVYDGSSHNIVINYILEGGVYVRND
ncbi:hypothetical protein [Polaribacter sp. Asnod6-C07]|uniref:hypothetical protein n=1 Tax=Polaribacter sp. Asnod6-C07 TaxID=3160582 RepID=UPI00386936FC